MQTHKQRLESRKHVHLTDQQWDVLIATPCRALVFNLQLLSEGWGALAGMGQCASADGGGDTPCCADLSANMPLREAEPEPEPEPQPEPAAPQLVTHQPRRTVVTEAPDGGRRS